MVDLRLGDCLEVMRQMPDASVDLVMTSPPYWNQREYSRWGTYQEFMGDCSCWIAECSRVVKNGRHIIWVIPDKIPFPPKENGTKERVYLPFYADCEVIASGVGLMPEFPVIWDKRGANLTEQPWSKKMWGSYPYPIGIIHTPFTERICIWRKRGSHGLSRADREDSRITAEQFNKWACDIWSIRIESGVDHPAPFPLEIPTRAITLWSKVGDVVLDPFMGSGTTGIACVNTGRNFIGIEKIKEHPYFEYAQKRITESSLQYRMALNDANG